MKQADATYTAVPIALMSNIRSICRVLFTRSQAHPTKYEIGIRHVAIISAALAGTGGGCRSDQQEVGKVP